MSVGHRIQEATSHVIVLDDSPTVDLDGGFPTEEADSGIASGVLLGGSYRVVREIGGGAMGKVFLGHDEHLDREVAIKVLRLDVVDRVERLRQFQLEARSMAAIRHPNVVEVYSFGQHGHEPYFVMEFVDGETLASWWSRQKGALDLDTVIGIMDPLCRGVQALHDGGVVHGDLKPGNVLLGSAGRIAVADLGLVRRLGHVDPLPHDRIEGTPGYMAPEAIQGTIDVVLAPRIDVYALGVMAFELLTGLRPFDAPSVSDVLSAHQHEPVPAASQARRDLSAAFDEVIHRAMAKDPRHRTESVESFRRALHRARGRARGERDPLRVLLTDDDPDQRSLIRYWLEWSDAPVRVFEAENGEEALSIAANERLDVALVDLHMPVMDGVRLTAELRRLPSQANLPIVVCTGFGGANDWRILEGLGASGFLVKPLKRDQLLSLTLRLAQDARSVDRLGADAADA